MQVTLGQFHPVLQMYWRVAFITWKTRELGKVELAANVEGWAWKAQFWEGRADLVPPIEGQVSHNCCPSPKSSS